MRYKSNSTRRPTSFLLTSYLMSSSCFLSILFLSCPSSFLLSSSQRRRTWVIREEGPDVRHKPNDDGKELLLLSSSYSGRQKGEGQASSGRTKRTLLSHRAFHHKFASSTKVSGSDRKEIFMTHILDEGDLMKKVDTQEQSHGKEAISWHPQSENETTDPEETTIEGWVTLSFSSQSMNFSSYSEFVCRFLFLLRHFLSRKSFFLTVALLRKSLFI